jgi:hypothetical protein
MGYQEMRAGVQGFVQGFVLAMVVAGFISLVQFAPQPNWFTNVHATVLIWCIAVFVMFVYTQWGESL